MIGNLVIGAGISGCTAGIELAQAGQPVEIIEAGGTIGGKILSYCCKATEDCSRCGVCLAHSVVQQAARHPGIRFRTGTRVEAVRRRPGGIAVQVSRRQPAVDYRRCIRCGACAGACPAGAILRYSRAELLLYRIDYDRCLLHQGKRCSACRDACPARAIAADGLAADGDIRETLRADRVLIAIGHEPFDAARKIRLGHGRLANVLTGAEVEETLSRQSLPGRPGESIAFVQCVGSRDPRIGRNYCSSVCCGYALRLARMLRHRDPQAEVTVYHIDLQSVDKTFTLLRRELEERGVRFVRGLPSSVERAGGRLKLRFDDPQAAAADAAGGMQKPSPQTAHASSFRAERGASAKQNRAGQEPRLAVLQDADVPRELSSAAERRCRMAGAAEHDRVVLSVGLGPAAEAARMAGLFGLERDAFGFLRPAAPVFVTGTCREPQSIPECIASARAAALEMLADGGKE
jgi:heterodisulfide reductase subunit A-like polyferredoxin